MWRHLVIALLCAAVGFGFNSNSPGGGGAVAGGTCTGGQFMSGITTAGVPICTLPSGGAPFPPGNVPQIGGYSALNAGEAETVVGDFTFSRTGANQYTATVTKLNGTTPGGTCTGAQFVNVISASGVPTCAALPAPAAGSITDAMLTGAYSGVGACSAGTFASTLNRNGAPTCTAPPSVATPYAVTIGGTGTATAPTTGQILVAQSATAYAPVALSGDGTISPTGALTITSTGGVAFTGLATAAVPLSTTMGGTNTTTAPAGANILIAQNTTTYAPKQMVQDGSINTAGQLTVDGIWTKAIPALAAGYLHYTGTAFVWDTPAGGFTAGGDLSGTATSQTVIGIRSTTVPALAAGYLQYTGSAFAWTTPTAGAPATNPAGGAGNYAPIASPTFTGAVTAPTLNLTGTAPALTFGGVAMGGTCGAGAFVNVISNTGVPTCGVNLASLYAPLNNPANGQNNYAPIASPTFSGTVTMPDASTIPSTGYNNVKAMGIGQAVGVDPLDVTKNVNGQAAIGLANNSTGANAQTFFSVANGTSNGLFVQSGTGFVGGANRAANATEILTNAANGIVVSSDSTGPVNFFINGVEYASFNTTDNGLRLTNSGGLYLGAAGSTTPNGQFFSTGSHDTYVTGGAHYNGTWIADAANVSIIGQSNGVIYNWVNTGLTVGASFSPATIMQINGTNAGFFRGLSFQIPTNTSTVDSSSTQLTIAQGATATMAVCSGLWVTTDTNITGDTCVWATGAGNAVLISQTIGAYCVAQNASPPASSISLVGGAGSVTIHNNMGSSVILGLFNACTREYL